MQIAGQAISAGRRLVTHNSDEFSHIPRLKWEDSFLKELNESRWQEMVREELKRRMILEAEVASRGKGADWKVEIAKRLCKETTAKNPWIAGRLKMGHPNYVSNLVHRWKSLYFAFDLFSIPLTPSAFPL